MTRTTCGGRAVLVVALAIALAGNASSAWADDASAKALFDQGKTLFAEGKYGEACAKLDASFKLNPLSGTRGLLGACYEKIGKLASAWAAYRDAAAIAERQHNPERATAARASAAELEPRLARVTIDARAVMTIATVRVTIDGVVQPPGALNTELPVDGGQHLVEATALDHKPWKTTLDIADGEKQQLAIPRLVEDPGRRLLAAQRIREERQLIGRRHRIALGLTATGGASVIAAVTLGALARGQWTDARAAGCTDAGVCPDARAVELVDRAATKATLATIFGGAGLALIGVGAFVYLTTPSPHVEAELKLTPIAAPGTAGLLLEGRF